MHITVVADLKTTLGENPLWDADTQRIFWVDSLGRRLFRATADGQEIRAWDFPASIGSMALRHGGGAVVALRTGVFMLDFHTGALTRVVDPGHDRAHLTLNDGKVDRQGRFIFGSMVVDAAENRFAALYRLDTDLSLHRLRGGIGVSNGPCWSPDGCRFYFSDTHSNEMMVYDYVTAEGALSRGRPFVTLPSDGTGRLDGACVDAEGCVWSAHCGAGQIVRYQPDGTIDRVIQMPVRRVTSVAFGGAGLDILFVTSMAHGLQPDAVADHPLRGALFAVHGLGVTGMAEPRFAG
ncbi:SMP-30/gluconolactonase/LRE family protein [Gluconobacter sp. OJA]|uniref:SMP-30/gluconolactonase/LRE family protein n=1 Tax=Acetobacteraceae TaxID=433 RepID=UPI0031F7E89D